MRRLRLLWGYWLAAAALLIGTMFLCSGFLRGPGKPYVLLPFPLIGLVAACVVAIRNTPPGASRVLHGILVTGVFGGLMCVPTWLWWGGLEWKVRTIPVPPDATVVRRSTGGLPFDGFADCHVEFQIALPEGERERLQRLPDHEWREWRAGWAALEDTTLRHVHAFYREEMAARGWEEVEPDTATRGVVLSRPVAAFSAGGETLLLTASPNTSRIDFLVQLADPRPSFGQVRVPGPPWTSRPAPVRPMPAPAPPG